MVSNYYQLKGGIFMLKTKITYKSVLTFLTSVAFSILLTYSKEGACFLALPFFISLLYLKVNPIFCVLILMRYVTRFWGG